MLDNDAILKSCFILAWQPIFYLESCSFFSFEKIAANVTEREVSEEELEFDSDYSYDYDTDSYNDE